MKCRVKVKPLSVNDAYTGRRFSTPELKAYKKALAWSLPRNIAVPDGDFMAIYTFGVSSPLSDWDGPIKAFQDALQDRYGFNDRRIIGAFVKKEIVPKGSEFAEFEFVRDIQITVT